MPTKRRVIRARDIQFNEDEFYNPDQANQHIRIYEDFNTTPIDVLDFEETNQILDDIDIPIQDQSESAQRDQFEAQQDLGGERTTSSTNFDPPPLSEPSDTAHIRLTSHQDDQESDNQESDNQESDNQESDNQEYDEILGDQPPTPPLDPTEDLENLENLESLPTKDHITPPSPFVMIDNSNFDPSGYIPLDIPKRSRSDSDTSRDEAEIKHQRTNLAIFNQAFSSEIR